MEVERRRCGVLGRATRALMQLARCFPALSLEMCIFKTVMALDKCFGVVLRIVGPFFVLFLLSIIGFNVYLYFTVMLPQHVLPHVGVIGAMLNFTIGLWILVNLLFNYLRCVFMSPGYPSKDTPMPDEPEDQYARSDHIWRWCSRCRAPKPPRSHHCSVCNRCVLKMDHHCPWINNCVGHRTYRHFLLFVTYLLVGCGFVLLTAAVPVYFPLAATQDQQYAYMGLFATVPNSANFLQIIVAFSASVALCLFGMWHVFLTLTGQTTLEFYINAADRRDARKMGVTWRNPFNHGAAANAEDVLLAPLCDPSWLLPSTAPPVGNGMDWFMVNSRVSAQV